MGVVSGRDESRPYMVADKYKNALNGSGKRTR